MGDNHANKRPYYTCTLHSCTQAHFTTLQRPNVGEYNIVTTTQHTALHSGHAPEGTCVQASCTWPRGCLLPLLLAAWPRNEIDECRAPRVGTTWCVCVKDSWRVGRVCLQLVFTTRAAGTPAHTHHRHRQQGSETLDIFLVHTPWIAIPS
jgi:hypothetical protein